MLYEKLNMDSSLACIGGGNLLSEGPFRHPSRCLDFYVLLLGIRGEVEIFVEDVPYLLGPGDILLLPAGKHHQGKRSADHVSYYWAHFTVSPESVSSVEFSRAMELYRLLRSGNGTPEEELFLIPRCLHLPHPARAEILFQQLLHGRQYSYYTPRFSSYCLGMLLVELTQQAMEFYESEINSAKPRRFALVLDWIRAHAGEPVSLTQTAAQFGYNSNYLSNLITQKTGVSFRRFLNRIRIDQARALLTKTDLPVRQIAAEAGIPDEKYFMRLFRQETGMTPTQYRNAFFETYINAK